MKQAMEPILIDGGWQAAQASGSFRAHNPGTGQDLAGEYPISSWADCDRALDAAVRAAVELRRASAESIASFLERYAAAIESRADEIVATAHAETALPVEPRLRNVELPRTTTQLRQAAAAAREGSWAQPVLDTKLNIRSCYAPAGPVLVFGPNNFPFAYNGVAGGDFASAIAVGCPVIAKAHPLQPGTSKLLAQCAVEALEGSGLPAASVQMLYNIANEDGLRLVADLRVGGIGFTGSRAGGLKLKEAADRTGRPIYLELSSLNPVVFLPGAMAERAEALAGETADSGLAGTGQFCTSPNLLFVLEGEGSQTYIGALTDAYSSRATSPMLSSGVREGLHGSVSSLIEAGAELLTGGEPHPEATGYCYRNTVLRVSGRQFRAEPERLQREAFGNATMLVLCRDKAELLAALGALEGNLTGSIYSAKSGADDGSYAEVEAVLRPRSGRLLNDRMPTGVALSPAMNHGGPWPSTGQGRFTAVGIPRALERFVTLQCFDGIRQDRLPDVLRDTCSNPLTWRMVDGAWTRGAK